MKRLHALQNQKPEMLQTGDSGDDLSRICNAIFEIAMIGIEEFVILCITMQESAGHIDVRSSTD